MSSTSLEDDIQKRLTQAKWNLDHAFYHRALASYEDAHERLSQMDASVRHLDSQYQEAQAILHDGEGHGFEGIMNALIASAERILAER